MWNLHVPNSWWNPIFQRKYQTELTGAKKDEKRNAYVISIDNPYYSAYNQSTEVWLPKYKSVAS